LAQGGVCARRKSCQTFKRSLPREHLYSPSTAKPPVDMPPADSAAKTDSGRKRKNKEIFCRLRKKHYFRESVKTERDKELCILLK
jgi:hypothetical protein